MSSIEYGPRTDGPRDQIGRDQVIERLFRLSFILTDLAKKYRLYAHILEEHADPNCLICDSVFHEAVDLGIMNSDRITIPMPK